MGPEWSYPFTFSTLRTTPPVGGKYLIQESDGKHCKKPNLSHQGALPSQPEPLWQSMAHTPAWTHNLRNGLQSPAAAFPPLQGGGMVRNSAGAKNHWVRKGHHWTLNICTYNVRTLMADEKLKELEHEIDNIKWDIVGLGEVRRKDERKIQLSSGNILFWKGSTNKNEAGVGFLINKNIAGNVTNFKAISERLIKITLRLSKNYTIKVIQVYAPTTSHSEEETEDFYEQLQDTIDEDKTNATIVMGDLNAKIGINPDIKETSTGKFGLESRNDRGTRLVDFATYNNLKIANTFFKKRDTKRWTWRSPNDRTRNEIDYILTDNLKNMTETLTINNVNVGSDHRLLRCKLQINTKQERF